jgi:hypothetical protein
LVARDKEFAVVLDHIARRKSLHIYGDKGMGKSALLDQVYDFLKARGTPIPIYCRSSRTLREILLHISVFLLDHFKHLSSIDKFKETKEIGSYSDVKRLTIRTLRNLTFTHITERDFCIILDHLEYVTPTINGFLSLLSEKAPVVTASRQSWELGDYSFRGRLDYALYLVAKLRLENLNKKDAFALIENLCRKLNTEFSASPRIFEEIFYISKGNPGVISQICEKARRAEYNRGNGLNSALITIDSKLEELSG